jgi:hypothetical protein
MSHLHHLSNDDLDRYHFDAIRGPEPAMVEEHLLWCRHCLDRAEENLRSIREKGRAHVGHISTDNLELYQLGHMTDALAIAEIDRHVSACRECADRMLAIDRFISLVRAGVIRRDSLPSFPISDSAPDAKRQSDKRLGKIPLARTRHGSHSDS